MQLQAQALAQFMGSTDYSIDGTSIHINNNKFSLLTCETNGYTFRIPAKFKHPDRYFLDHYIDTIANTINDFFVGLDAQSFLKQFTQTTCIVVNADMQVSLKSIFTKKKQNLVLAIPLFEQHELNHVNFSIEKNDSQYITCMKSWKNNHQSHNLKHLYLLSNFEYQIKKMFGTLENIDSCSDLLDMYFL